MAHPCQGCQPEYIDHATICPALGVIAAGRCKRIRHKPEDIAFDSLHGWAVNKNKRKSIQLRSPYFTEQYPQLSQPKLAYYDPLLGLVANVNGLRGSGLKRKGTPQAFEYGPKPGGMKANTTPRRTMVKGFARKPKRHNSVKRPAGGHKAQTIISQKPTMPGGSMENEHPSSAPPGGVNPLGR